MKKKFLCLLVIIPLLLISTGCVEKTIYIKTKCASVPTYNVDKFKKALIYEVYQVEADGNVTELVKGIPIDTWVAFIDSYRDYKRCCEAMNRNAIKLNEFNSKK